MTSRPQRQSLYWSMLPPPNANSGFVADGWPPFDVNNEDIRRGIVKVNAKSPTGKVVPLDVVDNSGVFSTNFTPTETGDWSISIQSNGKHVDGSPFTVRVYDPGRVRVAGLTGGIVGKSFTFEIDTTDAGDGQLAVDLTYSGHSIPVAVVPDNAGRYRVSFTPQGAGLYYIRVHFAGVELPGSPFLLEIVGDANDVTVSGDGLGFVQVGRRTSFRVNARRFSGSSVDSVDSVKVIVRSPRGARLPVQTFSNQNGSFNVEYIPQEVGEHVIDVAYHGTPIPGSPFTSQAFDSNAVIVRNLESMAVVNNQVEFDIDAGLAGCGNLEIVVNDGQVPCMVNQLSSHRFHGSFVPRDPINHNISMAFNGLQVAGSPWTVEVSDSSQIMASGSGLKLVPVGKVATFDVVGCPPRSKLATTVISPSGRTVASNMFSQRDGLFKVEYIPLEVGIHRVTVNCDGQSIAGSPWNVKAYNSAGIKVMDVPPSGVIGCPVEFTVDMTEAGEGQLEIMVNRGMVPNTVRAVSSSVFQVSFVPRDTRPHTVDIKFNGEPLPRGPITILSYDVGKVTASGDGLQHAAVNQLSSFHVDTRAAGEGELNVTITDEDGVQEVPAVVRRNLSSGFDVEYTTRKPGGYKANVTYGGLPVSGSPFIIQSFDPSKVLVRGVNDGFVGKESSFTVDVMEAGEGNMELSVTSPSGWNIPNQVKPSIGREGCYDVMFTPVESGLHQACVLFNDVNVPGSPFRFHVSDLTKVTARGNGLVSVPCGQPATFNVASQGLRQQDIDIRITAPDGRQVNHKLYPSENRGFVVEYLPTLTGDYQIDVTSQGLPIVGSPFVAKAWDASQVIVSNLRPGRVGKSTSFNVDASRAGVGNLEINASVGADNVPNFVSSDGNGKFRVSFTPVKPETHSISVKFNGDSVPGSPFLHELLDAVNVVPLSNNLIRIPLGRPAIAAIDPGKWALQNAEPVCEVITPSDKILKSRLSTVKDGNSILWRAEFIPREIGPHCIQITVAGIEIAGSPFACEVYDGNRVEVNIKPKAIVGKPHDFEVDVGSAGAGELDVVIKANNYRVPLKIVDKGFRLYSVQFMPKLPTRHLAYVLFANEAVPGSPFVIDVEDSTLVDVRGQCTDSAPVRQLAEFSIDPSRAPFKADAKVVITGPPPARRRIPFEMTGSYINGWNVKWTPYELGIHNIEIKYGPSHVVGSPFKCKVYDLSKVLIIREDAPNGLPTDDVVFFVDASDAGAGNLEVVVHSTKTGMRLPNFLEAVDRNAGKFRIHFTPKPDCFNYRVDVSFNEQAVASSPFYHAVLDGKRATASGEGLGQVIANRQVAFDVKTKSVGGEADLEVSIESPNGQRVPAQIRGSSQTGFRVAYTPRMTGRHEIAVKYADVDITGSPFYPEVYDPSQVRLLNAPQSCVLGQPIVLEVDCSGAGEGRLSASCRGGATQPFVDSTKSSSSATGGRHQLKYFPTESGIHTIDVLFNDTPIPGSPCRVDVLDASTVVVHSDDIRSCLVNQSAKLYVDLKGGAVPTELTARVIDPYGREVHSDLISRGAGDQRIVEFTPIEVGPHTVEIQCSGLPVHGSPFTAFAYNASKVRLVNVPSNGIIGKDIDFTVDTSEAGLGVTDVIVSCNNARLSTKHQQLSEFCQQFTFTPIIAGVYVVSISFNDQKVLGAPFTVQVVDPTQYMSVINPPNGAVVNSQAFSVIETAGSNISLSDYSVRVTAPNGEAVPSRMMQQPSGEFRMEYSSRFTGRHLIEIEYAGRPVMGSPFYVEIYDPSKVFVESGRTSWTAGEIVEFDVIRHNAGKANLGLTITGPRDSTVPFNISQTSRGDHVTYVAAEPGMYLVSVTYGGLAVPGCPIRHDVLPSAPITAYGDGLTAGVEGKISTFVVDSKGQRGELAVQVDGPNSLAKCTVEPLSQGVYRVNYVPVEVGVCNVIVKWNGHHIEGSPFRATIINPERIHIVGGLDFETGNGNRMKLVSNQIKNIELDENCAGPGQLTALVTCNGLQMPVDIVRNGFGRYTVSFVPRTTGEYFLWLYLNKIPLPGCPVIGYVDAPITIDRLAASPPPPLSPIHDKVILTGMGLQSAKVNQQAEFVIDGTEAGPGQPGVKLTGLHADVSVSCVPIGSHKYQCTYRPTMPGAHLLYITWSNRQVRGSPFKVTVTSGTNASKVICSGESLRGGVVGEDMRATIDVRRAGSGELTAQCHGPTKLVYCELVDHCDGTFTLHITPQEPGRHVLDIKYGGEHVTGSPFTFKVQGAGIDTKKVSVFGPGIENGLLSSYEGWFTVNTTGAGSGQLTVRIRGPKGAFRVEMQRDVRNERIIQCRYDPTDAGVYVIQVTWSGNHVTGSPFVVHICASASELERARRGLSAGSIPSEFLSDRSTEPGGYFSDHYYIDLVN